jgi:hypothetical protein
MSRREPSCLDFGRSSGSARAISWRLPFLAVYGIPAFQEQARRSGRSQAQLGPPNVSLDRFRMHLDSGSIRIHSVRMN